MILVLENVLGSRVLTSKHGITLTEGSLARTSLVSALDVAVLVAVSVL